MKAVSRQTAWAAVRNVLTSFFCGSGRWPHSCGQINFIKNSYKTDSDDESRRVSMKGKMLVKQTMAAFSACILCCAAFASCGSPISEEASAGDTPAQASYESGELVAMARAYYAFSPRKRTARKMKTARIRSISMRLSRMKKGIPGIRRPPAGTRWTLPAEDATTFQKLRSRFRPFRRQTRPLILAHL